MTRTLEMAEKTIRLIKEKIVVKTTKKIAGIDLTPAKAEDLVNKVVENIDEDGELTTLLSRHVTADTPAVVMEIVAEDIAERISNDIAAEITQIISMWPDPSITH